MLVFFYELKMKQVKRALKILWTSFIPSNLIRKNLSCVNMEIDFSFFENLIGWKALDVNLQKMMKAW